MFQRLLIPIILSEGFAGILLKMLLGFREAYKAFYFANRSSLPPFPVLSISSELALFKWSMAKQGENSSHTPPSSDLRVSFGPAEERQYVVGSPSAPSTGADDPRRPCTALLAATTALSVSFGCAGHTTGLENEAKQQSTSGPDMAVDAASSSSCTGGQTVTRIGTSAGSISYVANWPPGTAPQVGWTFFPSGVC